MYLFFFLIYGGQEWLYHSLFTASCWFHLLYSLLCAMRPNNPPMSDRRDSFRSRGPYQREGGGDYRSQRSDSQNSSRSYGSQRSEGGGRGRGGYGGGRGGGFGGYGGGGVGRGDSLNPVPQAKVVDKCPAQIRPKSVGKIRVNGQTLQLRGCVPVHQFEIVFWGLRKDRSGKEIEVNLSRNAASEKVDRQTKHDCLGALLEVLKKKNSSQLLTNDPKQFFVYDRCQLLFCPLEILEGSDEMREFILDRDDVPAEFRDYVGRFPRIACRLKRTSFIEPAALEKGAVAPENERAILHYLDILISQHAMTENKVYDFGKTSYMRNSVVPVNAANIILKEGVAKATKVIRNERRMPEVMLQVEPKKGAFFDSKSVLDFFGNRRRELEDPDRYGKQLNAIIRGVVVRTTHLQHNKSFTVAKVGDTAERTQFEDRKEGRMLSVKDYFERRYGIRLKYPYYACIVQKEGKKTNLYPIEVLEIAAGQRLRKTQMPNELNREMIMKCQDTPNKIAEDFVVRARDIELNNSNSFFKSANVRVNRFDAMLEIPSTVLHPPSIMFGKSQQINVTHQDNKWTCNGHFQYFQPARIAKIFFANVNGALGNNDFDMFVDSMLKKMTEVGIEVQSPPDRDNVSFDNIARLMHDMAKVDGAFVVFISDSAEVHSEIKFLEIETKVLTQQIRPKNTQIKRDTISNILDKLNAKNGGTNYCISSSPALIGQMQGIDVFRSLVKDTLFIGIDMTHPAPGSKNSRAEIIEPTAVGFASASYEATCPWDFGQNFYIPGRKTVLSESRLRDHLRIAFNRYHMACGKVPTKVVVFRMGVSEGQLTEVENAEGDAFRMELNELASMHNVKTPIAMLIVAIQKQNSTRLFLPKGPRDPEPQNNVPVGTVVTERITNARRQEFVLASHKALRGTVKPYIATVIKMDPPDFFSPDHVINLTNGACYLHGFKGPISEPAILRSALQLAERAHKNCKYSALSDNASSFSSGSNELTREQREQFEAEVDAECDRMTQKLAFTVGNKFWM